MTSLSSTSTGSRHASLSTANAGRLDAISARLQSLQEGSAPPDAFLPDGLAELNSESPQERALTLIQDAHEEFQAIRGKIALKGSSNNKAFLSERADLCTALLTTAIAHLEELGSSSAGLVERLRNAIRLMMASPVSGGPSHLPLNPVSLGEVGASLIAAQAELKGTRPTEWFHGFLSSAESYIQKVMESPVLGQKSRLHHAPRRGSYKGYVPSTVLAVHASMAAACLKEVARIYGASPQASSVTLLDLSRGAQQFQDAANAAARGNVRNLNLAELKLTEGNVKRLAQSANRRELSEEAVNAFCQSFGPDAQMSASQLMDAAGRLGKNSGAVRGEQVLQILQTVGKNQSAWNNDQKIGLLVGFAPYLTGLKRDQPLPASVFDAVVEAYTSRNQGENPMDVDSFLAPVRLLSKLGSFSPAQIEQLVTVKNAFNPNEYSWNIIGRQVLLEELLKLNGDAGVNGEAPTL